MKNKKYIVSFLVPICILIIINFIPVFINIYGEEIILSANYYMPTDSFRGEYISLNYDINKVNISKLKTDVDIDDMDYVYVYLKKAKDYYDVDFISDKLIKNNKPYIKAKVNYINRIDKNSDKKEGHIRLSYQNNKLFINSDKKELLKEKEELEKKIKVKIKLYRGYFIPIDILL